MKMSTKAKPKPKRQRKPRATKKAAPAPQSTALALSDIAAPVARRPGLNKAFGEYITKFGRDFEIAPLAKWADTNIWAAAVADAQRAFEKAGCQILATFREDDVLVQEYHSQDLLVFIFHRRVPVLNWRDYKKRGFQNRDLYHVVPVRLTPSLRNFFVMTGRWKAGSTVRIH